MTKHKDENVEAGDDVATIAERGTELVGHVRDRAVARIKATHKAVHENPYKAIAIAAGIGALIGFFLARRGSCEKQND